jgi:hypothetical protein
MAPVELHDCSCGASGCAVRSFLVCFWKDFNAAWKIAWKCKELAAVVGVWDMTGAGAYDIRICESGNKGWDQDTVYTASLPGPINKTWAGACRLTR